MEQRIFQGNNSKLNHHPISDGKLDLMPYIGPIAMQGLWLLGIYAAYLAWPIMF